MPDRLLPELLGAMASPSMAIGQEARILAMNTPAAAIFGEVGEGTHYGTVLRNPALLEAIEDCLAGAPERRVQWSVGGTDDVFMVSLGNFEFQGRSAVLLTFDDMSGTYRAEAVRRDFVANVSHELRTPLTAMIGFVDTLKGPAKDDPAARDRFLNIMEAEAQRMNRLVDDLLSLSRVEADERMRPTEKVELCGLAQSVRNRLEPLANDRGVELTQIEAAGPVVVMGDQDQLRQVLTNLMENAIKYGGKDGRVSVQISKPGHEPALRCDGVRLSVSDAGPGIDPLHIPRLTERFYRVDSHRSRQMGGTGLGLAIVKHIVTRHRGRLKIQSELGKGSRFTVILPLA